MDIASVIAAIQRGLDPNQAVLAGADPNAPPVAPVQAPPPPQQAPPPTPIPQTTVPTGAVTPVTNPQPASAAPKVTQSPPDLANMYIELMKKNQNAAQLDSGLNLIAAGLSNSPTNRSALIQGAGAGHTGMSLSASDLINFQKQADAQRQDLILQNALPSLMKQYNMSPAQIQSLKSTGQLGDVLKHYATENLGTAVDADTGEHIMFNPRTGKEITRLGGEKPDGTSWHDGPNGPELRNDRTGELIKAGIGQKPDQMVITRPDGSQMVIDKSHPNLPPTEVAPAEKIGDKILPQQNELAAINADRATRGEAPLTAEALIKLKQQPATNINVGADGTVLPKPEAGYDYERGADGKPVIDPVTRRPTLYKIPGGGAADEAAAAAKKTTAADEKEAKAKVQQVFGASNVAEAVKEALKHVDSPGVVGHFANAARAVSPGGMPTDKYDAAVKTIGSNITIDTLARMRAASPTGGALGNVSDFEDKMLQSVIAPLSTATSPEIARKSLVRIQAAMELLADSNFNKDSTKFQDALEKRILELGAAGPKVKVERIK
jgi:hypothetical protein